MNGARFTIVRKHGDTEYAQPCNLTRREQDTLDYACSAYDYVLPRSGKFTGAQWIEAIRLTYDDKNLRTAAVIEVIAKAAN